MLQWIYDLRLDSCQGISIGMEGDPNSLSPSFLIFPLEENLSYIKELLSSRQLEPADFREMKTEYTTKLEKLQAKLRASNHDKVDFKDLLNKGFSNLS